MFLPTQDRSSTKTSFPRTCAAAPTKHWGEIKTSLFKHSCPPLFWPTACFDVSARRCRRNFLPVLSSKREGREKKKKRKRGPGVENSQCRKTCCLKENQKHEKNGTVKRRREGSWRRPSSCLLVGQAKTGFPICSHNHCSERRCRGDQYFIARGVSRSAANTRKQSVINTLQYFFLISFPPGASSLRVVLAYDSMTDALTCVLF